MSSQDVVPEIQVSECVGFRRLYDSIGCSLPLGEGELRINFSISEVMCEVYFGPRPRFGIWTGDADKYLLLDESHMTKMYSGAYQGDASKSNWPRSFFTEIFCATTVEVPRSVSESFHQKNSSGQEAVLGRAQEQRSRLTATADLIAGLIGIRTHRQFCLEIINENVVALREGDDRVVNFEGPSLEVLFPLTINENGKRAMETLLSSIGRNSSEALDFASLTLGWLLRAWAERDTVNKFVALFIPIELALEGVKAPPRPSRTLGTELRRLISDHVPRDRKKELRAFVGTLLDRDRPTLEERFELLAQEAKLPGWESDIQAFKEFNKIRNSLVHRGNARIRLQVDVGEQEIRGLEDMAERYINWALFRDERVYQSNWRGRSRTP